MLPPFCSILRLFFLSVNLGMGAEQVEQIVSQRAESDGVNEQLKATDELLWVGLMNQYQAAEEQVMLELVYM